MKKFYVAIFIFIFCFFDINSALKSKAFYIGCLGSKKTHASRIQRLSKRGIKKEVLSKLHGPIGLSIGAKTPAEIAVSVLGELVGAYRGRALQ